MKTHVLNAKVKFIEHKAATFLSVAIVFFVPVIFFFILCLRDLFLFLYDKNIPSVHQDTKSTKEFENHCCMKFAFRALGDLCCLLF